MHISVKDYPLRGPGSVGERHRKESTASGFTADDAPVTCLGWVYSYTRLLAHNHSRRQLVADHDKVVGV